MISDKIEKPKRKTKKKEKNTHRSFSIESFYERVSSCDDTLFFKHDEDLDKITELCQKQGQFVFRKEDLSTWYFTRTMFKNKKSIRMIFIFSKEDQSGGKVHDVEKIMKLLSDVERVLVYLDEISIFKAGNSMILDAYKFKEWKD